MAGPLALQPWQWGVLAGAYVIFFALPAVWMARKARRDGDNVFVWTLLVLVGSILGIVEYYEHRSILKRRAKRAARLKSPEREAGADEDGGRER